MSNTNLYIIHIVWIKLCRVKFNIHNFMYQILQHGEKTVEHVFSTMFYFMRHNSRDIQSESLNALGFVCVRHYNFMLEYKLKNLYIDILSKEFYPTQHKTQVKKSRDEIVSDVHNIIISVAINQTLNTF